MSSSKGKIPRVPMGKIVGGAGVLAAAAGLGYLGMNSIYSGKYTHFSVVHRLENNKKGVGAWDPL